MNISIILYRSLVNINAMAIYTKLAHFLLTAKVVSTKVTRWMITIKNFQNSLFSPTAYKLGLGIILAILSDLTVPLFDPPDP